MPKIKPSTLFCKRTLPILLVDDSPKDGMIKAAMLVQPIVDELTRHLPKLTPEVIHVEDSGNSVFNSLKTIDALLSITQPTILVVPGLRGEEEHDSWKSFDPKYAKLCAGAIAESAKPLMAYAEFLVASGGGFIIHVTTENKDHDLNAALPTLVFNPNSDSYMDIEYKVHAIVERLVSTDSINHHMTIQSVVNNPCLHNKLGLCLGSWDRDLGDEVEGRKLTHIVNVKGLPGSPITPEEFVNKVWFAKGMNAGALNPANCVILRNPSIESKLILARVLPDKKEIKSLTFIEV